MRIIVWGINYAPELTGIAPFNTGLCDYLKERGHSVEMVTTFPYYPFWKKIPGDKGRLYRTDDFDGVWVHRCWHYVPAKVTTLRRIWHELSFGLTSLLRILFLSRADVYVVVSPPLILGPLASLVGWIKRRPFVFHVQDLQPDAAVGLGMVKVGRFTKLLYKVEAWSYRHAALVSGISRGMIEAYTRKGVPAEKRVLFPNWLRSYGRNVPLSETEAERQKRGAAFRRKYNIPDDVFVASYSGNLGRKQGLETLARAAELLVGGAAEALSDKRSEKWKSGKLEKRETGVEEKWESGKSGKRETGVSGRRDTSLNLQLSTFNSAAGVSAAARPVLILIVGDGAMRAELEARVAERKLKNVRMMPLLIEADYHGMLAASDISLILQAPGTGQYFFPSKLLSVLAAGSPVLSVADDDSELAVAVDEGKFGVNLPPSQPEVLAETLQELAADPERVEALRRNTTWVEQFSGPKVLGDFEAKLNALGALGRPSAS